MLCIVCCGKYLIDAQSISKAYLASKAQLEDYDRARIRLEAEVSAGLIEGATLSEELVAVQVRNINSVFTSAITIPVVCIANNK